MYIYVATWYDETNQPFLQDFYNDKVEPADILIKYIKYKELFKRQVIATYPDTVVFSDGSRVIVSCEKVLQNAKEPIETVPIKGQIEEGLKVNDDFI